MLCHSLVFSSLVGSSHLQPSLILSIIVVLDWPSHHHLPSPANPSPSGPRLTISSHLPANHHHHHRHQDANQTNLWTLQRLQLSTRPGSASCFLTTNLVCFRPFFPYTTLSACLPSPSPQQFDLISTSNNGLLRKLLCRLSSPYHCTPDRPSSNCAWKDRVPIPIRPDDATRVPP